MAFIDDVLKDVRTAAIAGHVHPDGDCVGSTVSLYNYIKETCPEIRTDLYLEPFEDSYAFLKRADEAKETPADKEMVYDVFFALDSGSIDRIGVAKDLFLHAKRRICIDHHISNTGYADDNIIDPKASSVSEMLFGLMDEAHITKDIAEGLYLGIVQDTGVFQYSCTGPETMVTASKLIAYGIPFSRIIEDSFFAKSYAQNRILGKVLKDSRLFADGKGIAGFVTADMMEEYGVTARDLDGIVSALRNTRGVEAAVFVYETGPSSCKVSFRSKSYADVCAVASRFGGGGHQKAAGCSLEGTVEEVLDTILPAVEEAL